jgi:signal transduction histidine kinase
MVAACQSLARAALQTNDVMQVFDMAVADVGEVLNVDMVRIFLFDSEPAPLNPKAQFARTAGFAAAYPAQFGEEIVARVAASGKSAIFENIGEQSFLDCFHIGGITGQYACGFFAAFPMRGKLSRSGVVLVCINRQTRELSPIESNFIEAIVGQLTVALDYFRLSESLETAQPNRRSETGDYDGKSPSQAQIAAFVSCEVRSRLTSILGCVQLLQEQFLGGINAKQADALDTIASESDSLLETLISSIEGCPDIAPHD